MPLPTILEHYAREALRQAVFQELEDGSTVGRVPQLKGVIAFGADKEQTANELYSIVEDWTRLRIQAGGEVPVLGDVDLNTDEARTLAWY